MTVNHIYRQWVDENDVGNTCCLEPRADHIPAETRYRYRVTETWGDVPEQISRLVGEPTGFLLYPEWRGKESEQELWQDGKGIVGGWALRYANTVELDPETKQIIEGRNIDSEKGTD